MPLKYIYRLTVIDEFNRTFGYMQIAEERHESYVFQRMVWEVLELMGTQAYAVWYCDREEWDFDYGLRDPTDVRG